MKNNKNNNSHDEKLERIFNILIRYSDDQSSDFADWPDSDTILAFIENRATDTQKELLLSKLDESAVFRDAFGEIVQLTDQLANAKTAAAFENIKVPGMSQIDNFLASEKLKKDIPLRNKIKLWFERFYLKITVPALAASAAIIVMFVVLSGPRPIQLTKTYTFDPAFFASGGVKGHEITGLPDELDSALVNEFSKYIHYNIFEEKYTLEDTFSLMSSYDITPVLALFIDNQDRIVHSINFNLPAMDTSELSSAQLSILTFPDFNLLTAELSEANTDTLMITYHPEMGPEGIAVLAITLADSTGIQSAAVYKLSD